MDSGRRLREDEFLLPPRSVVGKGGVTVTVRNTPGGAPAELWPGRFFPRAGLWCEVEYAMETWVDPPGPFSLRSKLELTPHAEPEGRRIYTQIHKIY